MERTKEDILKKEFPNLYRRMYSMPPGKRPFWTIEAFGLECGDGWYNIIYNLSSNIEKLIVAMPEDQREPYNVVQVKEKFGGLRFYMDSETDEMSNLISDAEEESYKTCEECGKPGKQIGGGWIKTLCAEHRYERVVNNLGRVRKELKEFDALPRDEYIKLVAEEQAKVLNSSLADEEAKKFAKQACIDDYGKQVVRARIEERLDYWVNELDICNKELAI
jgi:hypothetical protein